MLLPSFFLGLQTYAQPDSLQLNKFTEKDVLSAKRVWQIIDLRDPQNKVAVRAGNPLIRVLFNAVMQQRLVPYSADSLQHKLSVNEVIQRGTKMIIEENPVDLSDPSVTRLDTVVTPLNPEKDIYRIMIMEDWVFDKKQGKQFPRIIALALLYKKIYLDEDLGTFPLCWLRYDDPKDHETDLVAILTEEKLMTRDNKPSAYSYVDWFEKRWFFSYVYKTSDQGDRSISGKAAFKDNPMQALMEAERLKNQLSEDEEEQWER
jgi:gliding motility associated protien GldN